MKHLFPVKILFVSFLLLNLAALGGGGAARAAAAPTRCLGAARLRGAYGLDLQGNTTAGQPYVAVGILQLQAGRFSLDLTSSLDGSVKTHDEFDGTAGAHDCKLTLTSTDGDFSLHGQIGSGKTILVAGIDASGAGAVVASGKLRKIGLDRCSDRTLRGNYTYITQGYDRPDPGSAVTVLAKTGKETFYGNGRSYYQETITTANQTVEVGPTYLAYHVNADCSFELMQDSSPIFYGVLVNNGRTAPYMTLSEGATRSGEYTNVPQNPPVARAWALSQPMLNF